MHPYFLQLLDVRVQRVGSERSCQENQADAKQHGMLSRLGNYILK